VEAGVLVILSGRMGWVYGRILEGVGRSFVVITKDSGMFFGVGIRPLRKAFLVLFGIACTNDASVATHADFFGGAIK
jgi:hypothetical protein